MTSHHRHPPKIRRILAIKLGHIGDVLLMTPALDLLHRAFPDAEIFVLLRRGTEAMLHYNPRVKEIIIGADLGKKKSLRERAPSELRLIKQLRKMRFDLAVNFSASDRGAIVGLLSGAKHRVGYSAISRGLFGRDKLYTFLSRRDWLRIHTVLKDSQLVCDFAASLGLDEFDAPEKITGRLTFNPSSAARDFAKQFWQQLAPANSPHIVVHPTSRWLFKCWNNENVATLTESLRAQHRATVLMTTGPDPKEIDKGREILSLSQNPPHARFGDLSLDQLAAVIQQANLFIGVDTAPMHIAAAVGTPVVALFGPSLEALWHPWTKNHILLRRPCPCILANKITCDKSKTVACMASLPVEDVLQATRELLHAADY